MLKQLKFAACAGALAVSSLSALAAERVEPPQQAVSHSGFYILGQAGYGWENYPKVNGVVARAAIGYQFNQYFAIDGGFTYLPQFKFAYYDDMVTDKMSVYAYDLRAKGIFPISKNLFLYGLGGVAYLQVNESIIGDFGPIHAHTKSSSGYFRPEAGVGAGFNITQHLALVAEYEHIFCTDKHEAPSVDAATLGVQYRF